MTTTPVSKLKLSCRVSKTKTGVRKGTESPPLFPSVVSTPTKTNSLENDDYSPIYFPSTQESNEDIIVGWDWNSPQASGKKKRKQKRLLPAPSPKYPIKRHPSNNQPESFERLKNELKALQEELALPDDESCLCISPQQEVEIKKGHGNNLVLEGEGQPHCDDFNDLFNDSLDEELVFFSQKIEAEMQNKTNTSNVKLNVSTYNKTDINQLINKYKEKSINSPENLFNNTFESEDISFLNTPKHSKTTFQRTVSDNPVKKNIENVIQTASGKLEFHRTKSFEQTVTSNNNLSRVTLEEIERKRLEAKAKLESKKKLSESEITKSLNKCLPKEIEQKRLQAMAKLEAKRLQELVEKKRQEALKKLQIGRMKNASQVKSTLTTRL